MGFFKNTGSNIREYHSYCSEGNDDSKREEFKPGEIGYWVEGDILFKRHTTYMNCSNCVFYDIDQFRSACVGPKCNTGMGFCGFEKMQ